MSKVMSLLEKCNFVEKVNNEESDNAGINQEQNPEMEEVKKDEKQILREKFAAKEKFAVKEEPAEVVVEEKPFIQEPEVQYEKKMMINDIYSSFGLENSSMNTVFMLENLINAMPQNLPKDVIKQSVINVMGASNINLNQLIADGEKRREVLANVMDGYNNHTNKQIYQYKEEIARLSALIEKCQEQIGDKEAMLEDQAYMIKCEVEKINDIIDYFS